MLVNCRYFVADHQTGETAHYPSSAQAVAAGRALARLKAFAQGLVGLNECEREDGCCYFEAIAGANPACQLRALVSVGKLDH